MFHPELSPKDSANTLPLQREKRHFGIAPFQSAKLLSFPRFLIPRRKK